MKTMEEILAANKAARSAKVDEDFATCVRVIEEGETKVCTRWDDVASQFKALGFKVERIKYTENDADGTAQRWWVYAQPAEEGAQQP